MLAFAFVIPLLAVAATADAQQHTPEPTLPELAREGIEKMSTACGPYARLDDIVSKADVIVYGTVVGIEARLSGDERHVLTDYRVQPFVTLYDGMKHEAGGPQTPMFTGLGGTLVVDGLTINESVAHNGRRVALNVGDEVVVMGTVEKQMLMLSPVSVFSVVDGVVKANGTVKGFTNDGPNVPLDQFLARVVQLSGRRSPRN